MNLKKAFEVAQQAHSGQYDKAHIPYINHPLYISEKFDSEEEKIVALLHDVCEDSDTTLEDLKHHGFCNKIIEAIDAITKRVDESYDEYVNRLKQNELAIKIKIKDLEHNMDLSRISNPTSKDFLRVKKYEAVLKELRDHKWK